ncbi:MAG TPA: hypothetical protein IAA14_04735 [Candidatus Blautia excrementigallinarum]|nr:hypothetical protein [Candidatus Blautia excrementigallinarum]
MAANQKTIFVYDDFSSEQPVFMGSLYVNVIKGGESYSFEYDKEWLKKTGLQLTLDPELMPFSGRQYPSGGSSANIRFLPLNIVMHIV